MTTDLLIRQALRHRCRLGIERAMAGKYLLDILADAERTEGIGVLYVPLGQVAAVEAFLTLKFGAPTERTLTSIDPEDN